MTLALSGKSPRRKALLLIAAAVAIGLAVATPLMPGIQVSAADKGKLTVTKVVVNTGGGTKTVADFPLFSNGTPVVSGNQNNVDAGTYLITETGDPNYTAAFSGACDATGTVTIAKSDDKTCILTNTFKAPKLTVVKVVNNAGGGTKGITDFEPFRVGTTVVSSGVEATLTVGTFAVTEKADPNYTTTWSPDCAGGSVTLNAGDVKTCTITNTYNPPVPPATLTVIKWVTNTHGGTKSASDFQIHVKSGGVDVSGAPGSPHAGSSSGVVYTLSPGAYTVSEDPVPGYEFVGWGGSCATGTPGVVTLASGESRVCTLDNGDLPPAPATLTVIKNVANSHGGIKTAADFQVHVKIGGVDVTGSPKAGAGTPGTTYTLTAGTYTVSEDPVLGYHQDGWAGDCTAANAGTLTLAAGDVKTCTINNADDPPGQTRAVRVQKVTLTAIHPAATFSVAIGAATYSPALLANEAAGASTAAQNLAKHITHVISEPSPPTDWTKVGFQVLEDKNNPVPVCSTNAADYSATASIPADPSDPKDYLVCVMNSYTPPASARTVRLIKVTDGGGLPRSFSGTITGAPSGTWSGLAGAASPGGTPLNITSVAGGAQSVSEDPPPTNWTLNGYNVRTGLFSDCSGITTWAASAPIAASGDATVCISNTYTPPQPTQATLTVTKVVTNTGGGTKAISDFAPFQVGGTTVASGVPQTFSPGTYSVTEKTDSNYATTYSADCAGGSVTLAAGDVKSCTITNTYVPPSPRLTIFKVVVGGNWAATAFGPFRINGWAVTLGQEIIISPGTYAVTEVSQPDYVATFSADCPNGVVTLAAGDVKTCTITNTYVPPIRTVRLIKVTDGGGLPQTFSGTITGAPSGTWSGLAGAAAPGGAYLEIAAVHNGNQTVVETPLPSNWTLNGYNVRDGLFGNCAGVTAYTHAIDGATLMGGGDATVCISNTYTPPAPKLTVTKVVVNTGGGTKVAGDFAPFMVGATTVTNGVQATLTPGTYAVTEKADPNYTPSFSGDCTGGSITLAVGDVKTCTITNTYVPPPARLTITKVVTGGGPRAISDFAPFKVGTTEVASGVEQTFAPGTYSVTEKSMVPYVATYSSDCAGGTVTLNSGDVKSCTITNTYTPRAPKLTVTKVVSGGPLVASAFYPLRVGSNVVNDGAQTTLAEGSFAVSETGDADYRASFSGDCDTTGAITLAEGDVKSCTITNTYAPRTRALYVEPNVLGPVVDNAAVFSGTVDSMVNLTWATTNHVPSLVTGGTAPLVYHVHMDPKAGYVLTGFAVRYATGAGICPAAPEVTGEGIADLTLTNASATVCVYLQPIGSLTVTKILTPSSNAGRFDLRIDGVAYATNAGDGGTTGAITLNAGVHIVSESAANSATSLMNYISSIVCTGPSGTSGGVVSVGIGATVACAITNTAIAGTYPPTGFVPPTAVATAPIVIVTPTAVTPTSAAGTATPRPGETPSPTKTATVDVVHGEKTPGSTPVPPAAGSGTGPYLEASPLFAAAGFLVTSLGIALLAMRRRRVR